MWEKLKQATAREIDDLLDAGEIDRWRTRVLTWYDAPENNPGIEPRYISYASVVEFTERAARYLVGFELR
ncbi:MAG: hypothetical protein HC802_06425 [Caldilineaceae bacterium]|nr:hypothetical protein [Caldilineaceae bacterium]